MNDREVSTQALVALVQAGDEQAREALFRRYLPRVAQMVALRLGVPRDRLPANAEDLAQDAILRALASISRFEMRDRGAFAAWLTTIVANCIRSHFRSRNGAGERHIWQRYGDLDLTESIFANGEPSPSRMLSRAEANDAIEAALLALPALQRRVLSLRFFAAMSHAEIAQEIGRTEANSRKLVQRGLEALKVELARLDR